MKPTAAQITEAQRIINQVGVPTEKVISDVAQLIAACDSWREECIRYHINEVVAPAGQPTPIEASRTVDAPASEEACHATRELRAENGRRLLANPREEFLTEEEIAAIIQRAIDAATDAIRAELTMLHESHDALAKEVEGLQKYKARLHWLHTCNGVNDKDAEGYEWGIYRVKFNQHGQNPDVQATFSDFSDLDAAMDAEVAAMTAQKGRAL